MKTHPISIAQAAQAAWSFSKFGLSDKEEAEIVAAQLRRVALVIPVAIPLVLTAIALVVLAIIEINAAAPDIWLLGSWLSAGAICCISGLFVYSTIKNATVTDGRRQLSSDVRVLWIGWTLIALSLGGAALFTALAGPQGIAGMALASVKVPVITVLIAGAAFLLCPVPLLSLTVIVLLGIPCLLIAASTLGIGEYAVTACLVGLITFSSLSFLAFRYFLEMQLTIIAGKRQSEDISLLLGDFEAQASDWLWETDTEGKLTYVPDRMSVASRGTAKHMAKLIDFFELPWQPQLHDMLQQRKPFRGMELPLEIEGKRRWWSISGTPLLEGGWRGVASDVTVNHAQLAALEASKEDVERALEVKDRFISRISHELRTPLNAIIGFSQLIESGSLGEVDNPQILDYLGDIRKSGEHLSLEFEKLIEFSDYAAKRRAPALSHLDLADVLDTAAATKQMFANANAVAMQVRCEEGLTVRANRELLCNAIGHLIDNAVRFSAAGGFVEIEGRSAEESIDIVVTDHGIGMSADELERAREPFAQADDGWDRRYSGLGLGLTLAEAQLALLGGRLRLDSSPGKGSSAHISLPRKRARRARGQMQTA